MESLKQKWVKFLGIALSPGSVIFTVFTLTSLTASYFLRDNVASATLLSILGSFFAGIAGSYFRDDYAKASGENVLEKKGRSAIRNLRSIDKQIQNIQNWVAVFAKEKISKEQKRVLAEVGRHLSTALMNIRAGFEDWVDIIPELAQDAERTAEITKKQEEVLQAYVEEILKSKKELIVSKDEKRVSELKARISTLEREVKDVRRGMPSVGSFSQPINSITLASPGAAWKSSQTFSGLLNSTHLLQSCNLCGKIFSAQTGESIASSGALCGDCVEKQFKQ